MQTITLPSTYIAQVQGITAAGGTITQRFQTIATRWETFAAAESAAQADLNAAILDPSVSAEELARLRTIAAAEAGIGVMEQASVRNEAAAHVLAALRTEYNTVAAANYETIRAQFNAKAKELVTALNIADAEAPAEDMVKATAKVRSAWSDGPAYAHELSALLDTLHAAALLAGKTEPTGKHDQCLIGLSIDATGLHRRRVWEAWNTTEGRGGKWRALWKLGATIEAPELGQGRAYREPKPMETRAERANFGVRQFPYDPEDDAHRAEKHQLQKTAVEAGIPQIDYVDATNRPVHAH
ncbi:hypothetical protein [Arthrobacter sp. Soil763]|uniref:hypothetical protein n=1 Tax=Arthrobacter sp. Soil763 TaxID=1736402 RepID=UPI0006FBBF0F|nr:hypothetical protein [Arthrobacter sp. Soil763]KRE79919.1 hypothetical protein ASG71_07740 [Arthrobacter sp. Soil763]